LTSLPFIPFVLPLPCLPLGKVTGKSITLLTFVVFPFAKARMQSQGVKPRQRKKDDFVSH